MAPNETKGSILSVFKQKVKLFASRENLSEIRQKELDHLIEFYQNEIINYSTTENKDEFEKLFAAANQAIKNTSSEFEDILEQVRCLNYQVNMDNNPEFPAGYRF